MTSKTVDAVRAILKKRKQALTVFQINKALEAMKIKPVSVLDLDKHFRHVCTKAGAKWLLGGRPVAKAEPKLECKKEACKKSETKKASAKKPAPKKAPAKNPAKKRCADKEPQFNAKCEGACEIKTHGNFDVDMYNMFTCLHNALVSRPQASISPEDYIFLAGEGKWPSEFRGVEVISNDNFVGLLLAPRKFTQKVKM